MTQEKQLDHITNTLAQVVRQTNEPNEILMKFIAFATVKFDRLEEDISETQREVRATKLELLEKLAPRYITDDHEVRIQHLESQTA